MRVILIFTIAIFSFGIYAEILEYHQSAWPAGKKFVRGVGILQEQVDGSRYLTTENVNISTPKYKTFKLLVQQELFERQSTVLPKYPHTVCTATMLKCRNKCQFVTNAHCIDQSNKVASIEFTYAGQTRLIPVVIKRVNPNKELAEVAMVPEYEFLEGALCTFINKVKLTSIYEIINAKTKRINAAYSRLGYSGQVNDKKATPGYPFNPVSSVKLVPTGLRGIKEFLEIKYIPGVRKGNSGGTVVDAQLNPLGIITRCIPHQETPYLIPIGDVCYFLNHDVERPYSEYPKNTKFDSGLYSFKQETILTGDSDLTLPGDSDLTLPGDSDLTLPGDRQSQKLEDPLFSFRATHAEVLSGPNSRSLIAVSCDKGKTLKNIEDHSDLQSKLRCGLFNKALMYYRDASGYPDREQAQSILKHFQGYYILKKKMPLNRKGYFLYQGGNIHMETSHQIHNLIHITKKHLSLWINIDVDDNYFAMGTQKTTMLNFLMQPAQSGDWKTISLIPSDSTTDDEVGNNPLICHNKSLLKLICNNDVASFSISLSDTKNNDLKFRFSKITKKSNTHSEITHIHGDLWRYNRKK